MSTIDSPEFRRRASEAAVRSTQEEQKRRALIAQQVSSAALRGQTEAHLRDEIKLQVDELRSIGQHLAIRATEKGVPINRRWITSHTRYDSILHKLRSGRLLAEGWLLVHKEYGTKMQEEEPRSYSNELVLISDGRLVVKGTPSLLETDDAYLLRVDEIPHPKPKEYMQGLTNTTRDNTPWGWMSDSEGKITYEEVMAGLEEFAGINELV